MSEQDIFAKLRWSQLEGMKAPLGSPEREEWNRIVRGIQAWLDMQKTAALTTVH